MRPILEQLQTFQFDKAIVRICCYCFHVHFESTENDPPQQVLEMNNPHDITKVLISPEETNFKCTNCKKKRIIEVNRYTTGDALIAAFQFANSKQTKDRIDYENISLIEQTGIISTFQSQVTIETDPGIHFYTSLYPIHQDYKIILESLSGGKVSSLDRQQHHFAQELVAAMFLEKKKTKKSKIQMIATEDPLHPSIPLMGKENEVNSAYNALFGEVYGRVSADVQINILKYASLMQVNNDFQKIESENKSKNANSSIIDLTTPNSSPYKLRSTTVNQRKARGRKTEPESSSSIDLHCLCRVEKQLIDRLLAYYCACKQVFHCMCFGNPKPIHDRKFCCPLCILKSRQ